MHAILYQLLLVASIATTAAWEEVKDIAVELRDAHGRRLSAASAAGDDVRVPDELLLNFTVEGERVNLVLHHVDTFDTQGTVVINGQGGQRRLHRPRLPTYAAGAGEGHMSRATLLKDGSIRALVHKPPDKVHGGRMLILDRVGRMRQHLPDDAAELPSDTMVLQDVLKLKDDGGRCSNMRDHHVNEHLVTPSTAGVQEHHSHTTSESGSLLFGSLKSEQSGNGRQLSELNTLPSGPPYGRLSSCPPAPQLYQMSIGLVLDLGYVARHGGADAALQAASDSVSSMNVIFMDQLGVEVKIGHVIVNEDTSATYEDSGPNYKPALSGLRNQCGAAIQDQVTVDLPRWVSSMDQSGTFQVETGGHNVLLSNLSVWIEHHAPRRIDNGSPMALWVLMTDCFPSPGVTGVANIASVCSGQQSSQHWMQDTGDAFSSADSFKITSTGTSGARIRFSEGRACPPDWPLCSGPSAIVSEQGSFTWRLMAHEVGHVLGGVHTFGHGGLMDYTGQEQFYDDGVVCAKVQEKLRERILRTGDCLVDAGPVCGNGVRETDEACDDGNNVDGDGCSTTCGREAGMKCREDANGLTVECHTACGDGILDLDFFEECDDDSVCCTSECKHIPGYQCTPEPGNECCNPATCQHEPTTKVCAVTGAAATFTINGETATYTGSWGMCHQGRCMTGDGNNDPLTRQFCNDYEWISPTHGYIYYTRVDTTGSHPEILLGHEAEEQIPNGCPQDENDPCRIRCADVSAGSNDPNHAECIKLNDLSSDKFRNTNPLEGDRCIVPGTTEPGICRSWTCVPLGTCGDGQLDETEECDDESSCCDQSTCQLVSGAQCSPLASGECCTDSCAFKTASTSCSGGDGFCSNGECKTAMHTCNKYPNVEVDTAACPILRGVDDACMERCAFNDRPACYTEGNFIADGTACQLGFGIAGACESGKCVEASNNLGLVPASPPPSAAPPPQVPEARLMARGCDKTFSHEPVCAEVSATAAIRCCGAPDTCGGSFCAAGTWLTEPPITGPGGNGETATFAEAQAECNAWGMRLCSATELEANVCCAKGCGYDTKMIWAADTCTLPPPADTGDDDTQDDEVSPDPSPSPDPLPSPEPSPELSPSPEPSPSPQPSRFTVKGCNGVEPTCALPDQTAAIKCCDGNGGCSAVCPPGDKQYAGIDIISNFPSGGKSVTFAQAEAECSLQGMRLCTSGELLAQECCFSGCGYDGRQIWTSTTCA